MNDDPTTTGRKRDPVYDVYEVRTLIDPGADEQAGVEVQAFVLVDTLVHAADRRSAIVKATEGRPSDERYGDFATVRSGEMKLQPRKKRVIEEDDWTDEAGS